MMNMSGFLGSVLKTDINFDTKNSSKNRIIQHKYAIYEMYVLGVLGVLATFHF